MKKTLFVIISGLLLCSIFGFSLFSNSTETSIISKTINIILIGIVILGGIVVLVFGGKHLIDNREDTRKRRSSFDYKELEGFGTRLTPLDEDFIENESWTPERTESFYKYVSDYYYLGRYKLFPGDSRFIPNETWTIDRIEIAEKNDYSRRKQENYAFDIDEETEMLFCYKLKGEELKIEFIEKWVEEALKDDNFGRCY